MEIKISENPQKLPYGEYLENTSGGGIRMRKPILYKHRGLWYARFWNETDKRYQSRSLGIKVEGKTERRSAAYEAALKLVPEMAGTVVRNAIVEKPITDMPLLEYAESFWQPGSSYIKHKALIEKKPLSENYILSSKCKIKNKAKPFPGFQGLTVGKLTKTIILEWMLWLAENGSTGDDINKSIKALRVPIKQLFSLDLIQSFPFSELPRAAYKEKKRGILTSIDIKKLIETPVKDPRSRLAVYLPLFCSMRMGEVRGLLWGDISDGIIHIQHNWQDKEEIKNCKCGSEGFVPMPSIVADLINELYKKDPPIGAPLKGPNDFVMAQKPNHPISRESLWAALRSELAIIEINEDIRKDRNIVFHSLRHSFVTACKMAELKNLEIMALSRHKDEKMIIRYADDHAKEAVDIKRIGKIFEQSLMPEKKDNGFDMAIYI